MALTYKQKCMRCKKNYVLVTWKNRFPLCYGCQQQQLQGEITDPQMKKLFDISEKFYKENAFLRSIKISYLRYGTLTEKQLEAFKKAVAKMKKKAKEIPNPNSVIPFRTFLTENNANSK